MKNVGEDLDYPMLIYDVQYFSFEYDGSDAEPSVAMHAAFRVNKNTTFHSRSALSVLV